MTCHEFTIATLRLLMDAGLSYDAAWDLTEDNPERMDELHGDLLTPEQAAVELMIDAHIAAVQR